MLLNSQASVYLGVIFGINHKIINSLLLITCMWICFRTLNDCIKVVISAFFEKKLDILISTSSVRSFVCAFVSGFYW